MRYVFYAFGFVAVGLFWMNTSPKGQDVRDALMANHLPDWANH